MVSFRFHLISLIAVFLALGIGITVGATVVDKATVSALESRLSTVDKRVDEANQRSDTLDSDVRRWRTFGDQAASILVQSRLTGIPVLLVAIRGTDNGAVTKLRDLLISAGAKFEGTVWLTSKMALDPKKPEDAASLADALDAHVVGPDTLRQVALSRLSVAWAAGGPDVPLAALRSAGFIDYDAPPGGPVPDLAVLPVPATRFVVASQSTADVPNELLAGPFTAELAKAASRRVVAVEPGSDAAPGKLADRAAFVGLLRADNQIGPLVSTVDDLEDLRGQVAAVLAVADLGSGRLGNYGVGAKATRLVPDVTAP